MKIQSVLKDYCTFNRKEQRGFFVLVTILTLLILSDVFISEVIPGKQVDFSSFAKEIEVFQKEVRVMDSLEKEEKQKKYNSKYPRFFSGQADSIKSYSRQVKETLMIELNAADTFELQRLRGIGPSYAKRIVRYRERLGGYMQKSQLLEIFGMDTGRYNEIKEHLTVNPDSVRRINLNTVTFKELLSHPYFPFEMTKCIMIYRKENKRFREAAELLKVKGISDSVFRKIKPYIRTD
jgi:competence ComEA-like helix-hairpin-helix protein